MFVGFTTGGLNALSYSICILYFSPIVLCVAFLFEPLFAQIGGLMLGIDQAPGLLTYIGALISAIGLLFVTLGSIKT